VADEEVWARAGEKLSDEWRLVHVEMGDKAILKAASRAYGIGDQRGADAITAQAAAARTWAAIAQAHYAAANVPARVAGPAELRTKTPYVIPGLPGQWEIRGMSTVNMGEKDPVRLILHRIEGT